MKHALLLICTAAALYGAAACPAHAEDGDPAPPGTTISASFPRFVPDAKDEASLRDWCEAAVAHADTQRSASSAAHWRMSAAWTLGNALGKKMRAAALMEGAATQFPPGDAAAGVAWLEAARLYRSAEDLDAADRALASARAYQDARAPVDAPETVLRQWEAMHQRLARYVPREAVALAEARGDYEEAAVELEAAAERREHAGYRADETAQVWARAARFQARAKAPERALADVDRALDLVRDEKHLAQWTMWRLYCKHGFLDDEGAPALLDVWPGEAFVEDAYAALRSLHGNPHAVTALLSLGSRAFRAGATEAALGFYRIALKDPVLLEAARENENLWRGLLAAYPIAMSLREFDEAHRILDVVAGTGAATPEEIDQHRLVIAREEEMHALAQAAEAKAREREAAPAAEEEALDVPVPDHPDRGKLRPESPEGPEDRDGARQTPGEGADGAAPSSTGRLLGAAALVVLLFLVLYGVVRRRR